MGVPTPVVDKVVSLRTSPRKSKRPVTPNILSPPFGTPTQATRTLITALQCMGLASSSDEGNASVNQGKEPLVPAIRIQPTLVSLPQFPPNKSLPADGPPVFCCGLVEKKLQGMDPIIE
jgi:hypothetical protein